MTRGPVAPWWLGLAVALAGCDRPGPATIAAGRDECLLGAVVMLDSTTRPATDVGVIAVAGAISGDAEYHDCRRLIVGRGLDSQVAVFARDGLDRLTFTPVARDTISPVDSAAADPFALLRTPGPPPNTLAYALAEVYSWGASYAPLGIAPGHNCLYLYRWDGAWHGRLVPVPASDGCLPTPHPARLPAGRDLEVRPRPLPPGLASADIPPVVRWQWDSVNSEHYVAVRCADQWCEAGGPGFVSGRAGDLRAMRPRRVAH